jgi:hypothetical protein
MYLPKLQNIGSSSRAYWQRQQANVAESDTRLRELVQERNALIQSLLGTDLDDGSLNGRNSSDAQVDFLSKSKRREFRSIEDRYGTETDRIIAASGGLITREDRDALDALNRQKTTDIDRLLTPEERREYDLRNSTLAQRLRNELDSFAPSEAEFRLIYQAEASLHDSGAAATDSPGQNLEEQLKSGLGDERYSEYQRSKDPGYQCLLKIADRYNLSRDTAVQVFDLKQSTEAQCAQVIADPQYTTEQKQAWVTTVRNQVGSTLAGILGDKGFDLYRDYAGSWIDRLGK